MFTRYLGVTTDFGFKKLFGEEESKPGLKHFLCDLLELPSPIVELTFLPTDPSPHPSPPIGGVWEGIRTRHSALFFEDLILEGEQLRGVPRVRRQPGFLGREFP